jgi:RNA polymerase sigma-70 factor (ECF subfamily)
MTDESWLLERFHATRGHLRKVAFRMLGSRTEADDAVQEAWMRVSRAGAGDVENLGGWLTTIVARVCLDMLRSRASRREVPPEQAPAGSYDAEAASLLADSVGPALWVVLQTLAPAERVAFVLHDTFDMTFEEIAPIVGRSPAATRQLASRARRRVQAGPVVANAELTRHREVVDAFLTASRDGDFEALLAVLDPDVVLRADAHSVQAAAAYNWGGRPDLPREAKGARAVAEALNGRGRGVRRAWVEGAPGAVQVRGAQPIGAWICVVDEQRLLEIELVMDPLRISQLAVEVEGQGAS